MESFLYDCLFGILTTQLDSNLLAMKLRCYRNILGIKKSETGPHDALLKIVRKKIYTYYLFANTSFFLQIKEENREKNGGHVNVRDSNFGKISTRE